MKSHIGKVRNLIMSGELKRVALLCVLLMVGLVLRDASAFDMGEMQVSSSLGEPLKARVDLIDLPDAQAFKVRMASVEEYRQRSLQYPDGIDFVFQLVRNRGGQPFVRITTSRPIVDPFVNLLIEVSSHSKTILKHRIVLLDPSLPRLQVAAKPAFAHKNLVPIMVPHAGSSAQAADGYAPENHDNKRFGKLLLSMSLSVFQNNQGASGRIKDDSDALDEELIEKEKTVSELSVKISQLQSLIKNNQNKPEANESVADVPAPSQSEAVSSVVAKSNMQGAAPHLSVTNMAAAGAVSWTTLFQRNFKNSAVYWLLLLLAGGVISWFNKFEPGMKRARGTLHGSGASPGKNGSSEACRE
jgi:Tfp pilus assembly protein FimV